MDGDRLARLQAEIDGVDDRIVDLLKARFDRSRAIGTLKLGAGEAPYDPRRVQVQIERFAANCAVQGLEPVRARQLISTLIAQVLVERLEAPSGQ